MGGKAPKDRKNSLKLNILISGSFTLKYIGLKLCFGVSIWLYSTRHGHIQCNVYEYVCLILLCEVQKSSAGQYKHTF